MERTIREEGEAVQALSGQLDMEKMAELVSLIGSRKGKVVMSGCGTSAMAARKAVHSLNCIECSAVFLTPSDAVHGGLGVLDKDDILILISKGGNTEELVQLIPACRSKGAVLVGVTEDETSAIGQAADLCLKVKVVREPCRFNMLATASTLAVISLFDAVCIALMQYTEYTKEQFAVIHPKGAVGERLTGKEASHERYDEGGSIQGN
ncbi:arabinose 5-phosphate isomerase [Dorea sp. D27]|nr:arabinose 5-phosphate isomerase [Dorea sp. D27]